MRSLQSVFGAIVGGVMLGCSAKTPVRSEAVNSEYEVVRGPVRVAHQSNVTLRKVRVANPDGDCIQIEGATNIVIDHIIVGPCKGRGISVHNSRDVDIRDSTVLPAFSPDECCERGTAILARNVSGLVITRSRLADAESLIEVIGTDDVLIEGNQLRNPRGPYPRGQMIQLQRDSSDITIRRNHMTCTTLEGCRQEDAINIYSASRVTIDDNVIEGPISANGTGCGILVDGYGARDVTIRGNRLLGQADGKHGGCGIGIAGGDNVVVEANRVSGYGNIAFYVWAQPSGTLCRSIIVRGNVAGHGEPRKGSAWFNPYWDGGGCGSPVVAGNSWDAGYAVPLPPR